MISLSPCDGHSAQARCRKRAFLSNDRHRQPPRAEPAARIWRALRPLIGSVKYDVDGEPANHEGQNI